MQEKQNSIQTSSASESSQHNPNALKLTRRGKAALIGAAALASVGLAFGAVKAMDSTPTEQAPIEKAEIEQCFAAASDEMPTTIEVTVKAGEGVNDLIQRVYGINAPEGTNQTVENNPCYQDEYNQILEQAGSDTLMNGMVLNLPTSYYILDQGEFIPEQQVT